MVDSGKASDISVSSWPLEPIPWAPFPLLHQLSRQRPVSRACQGSALRLQVHVWEHWKSPCCLPGASAWVPGLCSRHPGEGDMGCRGNLRREGWEPPAPPGPGGSSTDSVALSAAQSQAAALLLRGDGAGQPGEELDSLKPPGPKHRQRGSAFKTNHILFPRNKLSEGISNTLTIQSTRV